MQFRDIVYLFGILQACFVGTLSCSSAKQMKQHDRIFASNTSPQLVTSQFSFTEGPAVDDTGNVYFTDQPNDRIWKYDTEGNLSLFMEGTLRSNGMFFAPDGNLISCADEKNELISIAPGKKITVLVDNVSGKRLNGPNDVWVHPNGDMYFTDPLYERSYWEEDAAHISKENVYYLPRGKNEPLIADDDIEKPNGIVGTPDGRTLYVADIKANKTYRYEIGQHGKLQNRKLFVNQGSDGMTIDNYGNIYLTGKGVTVFNAEGMKIAQIDVPADWTANVCFGGKKHNILFITASQSLFVMDMLVSGAGRK